MDSRTRPIPAATSIARPTTRRREVEFENVVWIDLPQPVSADVAFLRERLHLDPLALDDVLSTIQRPKVDVHQAAEHLFLIVHVPTFDRDQHVVVSQVSIFAGRDFVVTIHDGTIKPLRRLFAAAAGDENARKQLMGRGSGFLVYRALDALIKHSFPIIYRLDEDLDRLKNRLFSYDTAKLLHVHSMLERDMIALRHIFQPNLAVGDALRTLELPFLRIDAPRYFGDSADGMYRLYDMVSDRYDQLRSIGSTLSIVSIQQQSTAQRVITVVLLAIAPLVLLAAIAALSLVAPPREQPIVFAVSLLVALACSGGLVALARSRRWF